MSEELLSLKYLSATLLLPDGVNWLIVANVSYRFNKPKIKRSPVSSTFIPTIPVILSGVKIYAF